MIKWLWQRIKSRWVHPPVLDITDWDLKDALEQILFNYTQTGNLLFYWHAMDDGFYVKSIPGSLLVLDTPYGSIQMQYTQGVHVVGFRNDDSYFHAICERECGYTRTHAEIVESIMNAYRHIVDPAFTAQKRDFPS